MYLVHSVVIVTGNIISILIGIYKYIYKYSIVCSYSKATNRHNVPGTCIKVLY